MPARRSSNHVGMTPSSIANSKLVSHWIASWSWGMASRMASSSCACAPRRSARSAWSSGVTNALIGASGVGSDTWKRQWAGSAVALEAGEER